MAGQQGQEGREGLPVCVFTKLPSVPGALRQVFSSSVGAFLHCLQSVCWRSSVTGWELTDSKREKGNIKVGIKRLKIIASKGREKREEELRKKNGNGKDISDLCQNMEEETQELNVQLLIHLYWGKMIVYETLISLMSELRRTALGCINYCAFANCWLLPKVTER